MGLSRSDRTERMDVKAEAISVDLGHHFLSTEHILLACVDLVPQFSSLLRARGVDFEALREAVTQWVERSEDRPLWSGIPRSPRLKKIDKLAQMEAETARAPRIEPEHYLVGIVKEGRGIAVRVLESVGIEPARLRDVAAGKEPPPTEDIDDKKDGKVKEKILKKYGRELVAYCKEGKVDPVVGRQEEIKRAMQILTRKSKNNPVLIGEAGVGKTSVVFGLAQRIADGNVPDILKGKKIWEISMSALLAGAGHRGDFEERIQQICEEARSSQDCILFLDELHTLVGAGGKGSSDAANMLKPVLATGELSMIGATTTDEYRKHIEPDAALERRFQPVLVPEPSEAETLDMLHGKKASYETHHGVVFTDSALLAAVKLSVRYITERNLPDKAFDIIDEAAAKMKTRSGIISKGGRLEVNEEVVAEVVSDWSNVPVGQLTEGEEQKLLHIEDELKKRVVGQDEAVEVVAQTVRMVRMGLSAPTRPSGVFLFLGPTGVGKTELAKALANFLFGDDRKMIRLDMSEYADKSSMNRMIGSPPGYVGHEEEGQLTRQVRMNPYSVVLLDEIEKAHAEVYDLFLQVFDDGRLTDNKGRTVDFTNAIIVMTSNLGIMVKDPMGGVRITDVQAPGARDTIMAEVKKFFRPEFINRIDEIVIFNPLEMAQIQSIADKMLRDVQAKLMKERGVLLLVEPSAVEVIVRIGYDPQYGARPLRRAVESLLLKPLAHEMLKLGVRSGDRLVVTGDADRLRFQKAHDGDWTQTSVQG